MFRPRPVSLVLAAVVACAAPATAAPAPPPAAHAMVPHVAAFALQTKADVFADPEVFVAAPQTAAATGAEGIAHVADVRPALLTDDPAAAALNAQGKPLGFTLGVWFGARGVIAWDENARRPQVATAFTGLVPNGVYSLFAIGASGATPLDGAGTANTVTADAAGNARLTLTAPAALHNVTIALVYHSDGAAHGTQSGDPGLTVHHQLVFQAP